VGFIIMISVLLEELQVGHQKLEGAAVAKLRARLNDANPHPEFSLSSDRERLEPTS
jgi:hypothetical protein